MTPRLTAFGRHWLPAACYFMLLGILLTSSAAHAQTAPTADSSHISYSEETMAEAAAAKSSGNGYSRLTRLQIEEQRLWKLGLNDIHLGGYEARYGVYFIYEHKLAPAWSLMAEANPGIGRYRPNTLLPGPQPEARTGFAFRSQVSGRYYYNLNQRIRKGKSASNFSANYLSVALGSSLGRLAFDTPFFYYGYDGRKARLTGALLYGLQRRLGRYGFIDFNVGLPVLFTQERSVRAPNTIVINPTLTLRLGLALGR